MAEEIKPVKISELSVAETIEDNAVIVGQQAGNTVTFKAADLKGKDGEQGKEGEAGPRGAPGLNAPIGVILGTLENENQLPEVSGYSPADTWIIGTHFWTLIEGSWVDIGEFRGEAGQNAYQMAVEKGFEGTEEEWFESLKGEAGLGLRIRGSLHSTDDLPTADMEPGDAYIIDTIMWVWDTEAWSPVGSVGPEGPRGKEGPQGPRGFEGPEGPIGNGLYITGKVDKEADLPADAKEDDLYLIGSVGYLRKGGKWLNLGNVVGKDGSDGKDGDIGPEGKQGPAGKDGINGKDGAAGKDGKDGENGYGLEARGRLGAEDMLPTEARAGWMYYVGINTFIYDGSKWVNMGSNMGPKGDEGPAGKEGPQGPVGAPALIKGVYTTPDDLPKDPTLGDAYLVAERYYIWNGSDWEQSVSLVGPVGPEGPEGKDGAEGPQGPVGRGIIPMGALGDDEKLPTPEDRELEIGMMYYQFNRTFIWDGEYWGDFGVNIGPEGREGKEGREGPQGPIGSSIVPKGSVGNTNSLPPASDDNIGWLYYVGTKTYISDGKTWVYFGDVKGDKGDKGDTGERGLQGLVGNTGPEGKQGPEGPRGEKGEPANSINTKGVLSNELELPSDGNKPGDAYFIAMNLWVWTGDQWNDVGTIKGEKGDTGQRGAEGKQGNEGPQGDTGEKGEPGNSWITGDVDPNAVTGRLGDLYYNRKTQEYFEKTSTVRWTSMGYIGGGSLNDAPSDGHGKVRFDGEWKNLEDVFGRYSLEVVTSDVACDISKGNVFRIADAVGSIELLNLPADRAMTVVLVFEGKPGLTSWQPGIDWASGVPEFGDKRTIIPIFWDGKNLTGGSAMSV